MRRVYGFFWLRIARPHGIFLRENRGFKEFRSFPDMELGIFRVAKSPGEGRHFYYLSGFLRSLLLATFGLSQITNYSFNTSPVVFSGHDSVSEFHVLVSLETIS